MVSGPIFLETIAARIYAVLANGFLFGVKEGIGGMYYGVVLLFILVVMGGAIAFIGDRLGTKVGKKKLSIFGLRPRHTSIIVTIVTGILITASTLTVATLASENVRVALFGLEELNQQIAVSEQNLSAIKEQLGVADGAREKAVAALQQARQDQKLAEADLGAARARVLDLQTVQAELETAKEELGQKVGALGEEKLRLEAHVMQLGAETQRLGEGLARMRVGDIVYRAGELIANTVVLYQEKKEDTVAQISSVLQAANQHVLLKLRVKQPVEALWISQAEFERAVKVLHESKQDAIVRIVAAGNIVYGEPVRARIELFPNKRIYARNDVIYREQFELSDGNEPEAEELVISFLKKVNEAASGAGILPDPLQGSVGVMSGSQFYDIVNSIEPLRGTIIVTAYAGDDTNAAGPLRLRVKVEQVAAH